MRSRHRIPVPTGSDDAVSHAVALVLYPGLLGLLGAWIDHVAGTRPLFILVLAALGVIGSFISAYVRYEARMARHDQGKPWTRRREQGTLS